MIEITKARQRNEVYLFNVTDEFLNTFTNEFFKQHYLQNLV